MAENQKIGIEWGVGIITIRDDEDGEVVLYLDQLKELLVRISVEEIDRRILEYNQRKKKILEDQRAALRQQLLDIEKSIGSLIVE